MIPMSKVEARIIGKLKKGADFATNVVPGHYTMVPSVSKNGLACPMLVMGQCSIYENRPTICRFYGVVEDMPCEFGCKPEKMLTTKEAFLLIRQLSKI
jgi:Fe-S-cluster containining protein